MKKFIVIAMLAGCGPTLTEADSGVVLDSGTPGSVVVLDGGSVSKPDAGAVCVSTGCNGLTCEVDRDNCLSLCNCNTGCTRRDCVGSNLKGCCAIQRVVCPKDTCFDGR